jgi:anhydro-N-acetylmuramic acid kinase
MPSEVTAYIGVMSGTSLDAVDAVLLYVGPDGRGRAAGAASVELPEPLRAELLDLNRPGRDELSRAAVASIALAKLYAQAVHAVMTQTGSRAADIRAIGVHGQTVRHRPDQGYTVQLNAPAHVAQATGIDVIADFRSRDIAAGGQGAPLVPAFHATQFASSSTRVVLNLGGIANVTILRADGGILGFDTGPANMLMDGWAQRHLGRPYDADGAWAATGAPVPALLDRMLADPWFALEPPKSTGRDDFNMEWLETHIAAVSPTAQAIDPADVQATLLQLTTRSVADAVRRHAADAADVLVCGGGARNGALMRSLQAALPCPVEPTDTYGIPTQWVEAAAFAWLAWCHDMRRPAGLPAVTGARSATVLGCRYPA